MIDMTVAEVVAATGAAPHGHPALGAIVTRVVTDSRNVRPGDLFVAILGERYDGHDHATAAAQAGAVAVLAGHELGVPTLVVDDPVVAMGRLAHEVLRRLRTDGRPTVVGVTGSVGKTGTKDLLGQVLRRLGPTVCPEASFNNEIGLPATVLECDRSTAYLVLELGARGLGHIRYLTGIAAPQIGVVLGVGTAHIGEFGSREAIAQAKGELVEALPGAESGGVAVLNADDQLVSAMAARTPARIRTFGTAPDADVRAVDVILDRSARASFRLVIGDASAAVTLRPSGAHVVGHALATAAVADALGMPVDDIARALSEAVRQSPGRMAVTETDTGITVIDDAYNASPESVRSALESLSVMAGIGSPGVARRSWAVLGEMRELGKSSGPEHEQIGRFASRLGIGCLVTVGTRAAGIHHGAVSEAAVDAGSAGHQTQRGSSRALFVPTADDAITLLRQQVRPGDVVLVKASRTIGLDRVAAALIAAGRAGSQGGTR
ncbi:MAG: UDP-N-acetylmuramoyl-tripeptide--D-alanyl-D-alanine ligase [Candidatus Nanopelagicales bacterium]